MNFIFLILSFVFLLPAVGFTEDKFQDKIIFKGIGNYQNQTDCEKDLKIAIEIANKNIFKEVNGSQKITARCRVFNGVDSSQYVWHLKIDPVSAALISFSSDLHSITERQTVLDKDIVVDEYGELKAIPVEKEESVFRVKFYGNCDEFGKKLVGQGDFYKGYNLAYSCKILEIGEEYIPDLFEIRVLKLYIGD